MAPPAVYLVKICLQPYVNIDELLIHAKERDGRRGESEWKEYSFWNILTIFLAYITPMVLGSPTSVRFFTF